MTERLLTTTPVLLCDPDRPDIVIAQDIICQIEDDPMTHFVDKSVETLRACDNFNYSN